MSSSCGTTSSTLAIDYPDDLGAISAAKRRKPPTPEPYQKDAIRDVVSGLAEANRGQLIMACGTGKTFITLWIKERLSAESTLVLLPSLNLLAQTLREWTFAAAMPFDVLCVCSDATVGKISDEAVQSVLDIPFPVTTNVGEVQTFLSQGGDNVVFSTYQSSDVIAEAQNDSSVVDFDLVVADEAHRCAGKAGSIFATVLDQEKIRSKKRLFATATPRTYSTGVKKQAEGRGVEIMSMDDESAFGKPLYTLTFGEAIAGDLLTDYQVVIVGVDDPMIAEWIANRKLVATEAGKETDAESLAAQIGLIKAIKDHDLKRIISFHSRVNRAKDFSSDIQEVLSSIDSEHRPDGQVWSDYVSGVMATDKRRTKLERLKSLDTAGRGLLANARCLSEGVDVPALDGVAFIDPRRSQIDIVQAVGRAIRLSKDKKFGTIVLPVFIENDDDTVSSIESSKFKPVWDVINALKSHDDVLSFQLDQLRYRLGRHGGSTVGEGDLDKIVFDLPATVDRSFAQILRTRLVEQTTETWEFWFGLLEAYIEKEGDALVPVSFKTGDGYRLGAWVNGNRSKKTTMSPERIKRLDELEGWVWDALEAQWEEGYAALVDYVDRVGDARVLDWYKTGDGYRLGGWVQSQRSGRGRPRLSAEQFKRLDELEGWVWDVLEAQWEEGYAALLEYIDRVGDARVPGGYETGDGYRLGLWVANQRSRRASLSAERETRLKALPGWVWDTNDAQWEEGFAALVDYVDRVGDARIKQRYKTGDGYPLGTWVNFQRSTKTTLPLDRFKRLDALEGWVWDRREAQWEEGFAALLDYVDRVGDARVPSGYETGDGYPLGTWVNFQRVKKTTMSPDRFKRLDDLEGWAWDPFEAKWEEGFAALVDYVDRVGNARIKQKYKTGDGYPLGTWVNRQRSTKTTLSPDRFKRLDALEGWAWDVLEAQWEEGFAALVDYVDRVGDAGFHPDTRPGTGTSSVGGLVNKETISPSCHRIEKKGSMTWKDGSGIGERPSGRKDLLPCWITSIGSAMPGFHPGTRPRTGTSLGPGFKTRDPVEPVYQRNEKKGSMTWKDGSGR